MMKNGKVSLIVCFSMLWSAQAFAQEAKQGAVSTWESDLRTFGPLATMSYQNGKQVLGKYSPDLDKKVAAAKFTNDRMQAVLPAIGTIARDIEFPERVYKGLANPRPLTPDEIADRAKSFWKRVCCGPG